MSFVGWHPQFRYLGVERISSVAQNHMPVCNKALGYKRKHTHLKQKGTGLMESCLAESCLDCSNTTLQRQGQPQTQFPISLWLLLTSKKTLQVMVSKSLDICHLFWVQYCYFPVRIRAVSVVSPVFGYPSFRRWPLHFFSFRNLHI